jgi:hypothetical protein
MFLYFTLFTAACQESTMLMASCTLAHILTVSAQHLQHTGYKPSTTHTRSVLLQLCDCAL